uniref:Uncharacterized protein n=1 Tax=Brassica oleracea TaxID=3712 RepID=A0A3P6B962_BRAOL|nr:unnamed protein product [Brassica oleracea]
MTLPSIDSITRPSSSNVFEAGRLDPCERSPIRTLSEDRIHVYLRLGPLLSDTTEETEELGELPIHPALTSKAAGKRVARRRTARSTLQEVISMKKRRTNTTLQSHRRKLMLDAITAGGRAQRKAPPKRLAVNLIPAMAGKEKDFHPLQNRAQAIQEVRSHQPL